jgi:hypothetical protein
MKACVLTAVYDNYDTLKELRAQDMQHEAICVTDTPDLESESWRIVYEPRSGVHPNRAAKRPKMMPWLYTDAEFVIWVDASFQIESASFVSDLVDFRPLGQFDHWDRNCIYTEAAYCYDLAKYAGEPLADQAAYYRMLHHPAHWGLWATGLIVREWSPRIEAFGKAWLAENERWTYQDQVSEAPMLREFDLYPVTIPGTYSHNPWMQYRGSVRH